MSRLNLIVESLLRDIIEAQHAANCHAASLARQYGKHGSVRGFQLPSAQIGSLEFDLKYAVTGTSGVEERQVLDAEQCSLFQQELAERVPAYAIRSIVMAVVHSNLPADEARSDFSSLLAREEQWKRNFCLYLGKKITAAVSGHEGALLRADSGLDKGLLAELLADKTGRNPEELFLDKERVAYLEKRIATELSELERQVLDLYITGMSYTQIAKVLRRSEKATENALTRAKQKIRGFLSKESKF